MHTPKTPIYNIPLIVQSRGLLSRDLEIVFLNKPLIVMLVKSLLTFLYLILTLRVLNGDLGSTFCSVPYLETYSADYLTGVL